MSDVFNQTVSELAAAGVDSPRLEARILLGEVLGIDSRSILNSCPALTPDQQSRLDKMLCQRREHMPVDKIIGHRDFYKYTFLVNEDVLSPRPDTEILVEEAVRLAALFPKVRILDLGTGSGCILLSVLGENRQYSGIGVDISPAALDIAAKNASRLGVSGQVEFREGSWFDDEFSASLPQDFDLIVSNPPYIPSSDIQGLEADVREYDPLSALDGGADGFDSYRKIALVAGSLLKKGGYILLEAGIGQAEDINKTFAAAGFSPVRILKDLSGIERCLILKK